MGVLVSSFSSQPPFLCFPSAIGINADIESFYLPALSKCILYYLFSLQAVAAIWPTRSVLCLILCGRSLNAATLLGHRTCSSKGSIGYPWPGQVGISLRCSIVLYSMGHTALCKSSHLLLLQSRAVGKPCILATLKSGNVACLPILPISFNISLLLLVPLSRRSSAVPDQ